MVLNELGFKKIYDLKTGPKTKKTQFRFKLSLFFYIQKS